MRLALVALLLSGCYVELAGGVSSGAGGVSPTLGLSFGVHLDNEKDVRVAGGFGGEDVHLASASGATRATCEGIAAGIDANVSRWHGMPVRASVHAIIPFFSEVQQADGSKDAVTMPFFGGVSLALACDSFLGCLQVSGGLQVVYLDSYATGTHLLVGPQARITIPIPPEVGFRMAEVGLYVLAAMFGHR